MSHPKLIKMVPSYSLRFNVGDRAFRVADSPWRLRLAALLPKKGQQSVDPETGSFGLHEGRTDLVEQERRSGNMRGRARMRPRALADCLGRFAVYKIA